MDNEMVIYIVKRALRVIPCMFIISLIVFCLYSLLPGDYIDKISSTSLLNEEAIDRLKSIYGLNKPIYLQYINWMKNTLSFNFGHSFVYNEPVIKVIKDYILNSFILSFPSLLISIVVAVPLGLISANRKHSFIDNVITFITLILISIPSFILAMILLKWLSIDLKILPIGGMMKSGGSNAKGIIHTLDIVKHMILPVIVLVALYSGSLIRYVKESAINIIPEDYIRVAKSKGVRENMLLYKHVLKNSIIPIITIVGLSIPELFIGSIIIENVFSWPGIGKVAYEAVNNREIFFLMGFVMFTSMATFIGNFISDILYIFVDPRLRI